MHNEFIGPHPLRKTVMSFQSLKKCCSYRSIMSMYVFVVIVVLASSPIAVDSIMIPREWTMYIEQLIRSAEVKMVLWFYFHARRITYNNPLHILMSAVRR